MWGERGPPRGDGLEVASPAELAWLLLLPFAVFAVPVVALLAPPLGDVLFPPPDLHYWLPELVVRKPTAQAGYLLALACVAAYATAILLAARRGVAIERGRRAASILALQVAAAAFVVVCWIAQRGLEVAGGRRAYFTLATIVVATAICAALAFATRAPARRVLHRLRARLPASGSRTLRLSCLAAALLVAAVWLLPAVYTDDGMAVRDAAGQLLLPPELFGNAYYFDEASAVLNGRSPLVDMPAYGSLWPYAIALPLGALGGTYAAFTSLMAIVTGVALIAVYGVLRRLVEELAALALFVMIVATGFFIERGTPAWRYDPGTYFGVFPLRYAGPYLLAWLTARCIDRGRARGVTGVLLFVAAGLVALNNLDFGLSALGATIVAVAIARRPLRAGRLAIEVVVGVGGALALVCGVTLLRAGSLPHLGLLGHYGRVFVDGGFGNVALQGLGWHVVLSLTFVAALATAVARVAASEDDRLLTAMLAWTGVFGLGASAYYYAYRSHPDVLLNLFSIWAFALALLAIAVLRAERSRRGLPSLPSLLVLLGLGLALCSVAQLPSPWTQAKRLADSTQTVRPLMLPELAAVVDARTRAGERVAIVVPVGHRVARAAGVVNVSPYPGLGQMPAREQLVELLDVLRREGGSALFVAQGMPDGMVALLRRHGYAQVSRVAAVGWSGNPALEFRPRRR